MTTTDPTAEFDIARSNYFWSLLLRNCHFSQRGAVADMIAAATCKSLGPNHQPYAADGAGPWIEAMKAKGVAPLGRVFDDAQCADIVSFLKAGPTYLGHTRDRSAAEFPNYAAAGEGHQHLCHSAARVLSAPGVLELAMREDVMATAEAYLGCPPTFYNANAFWSYPGHPPHPYSQQFHRDNEDFRQFVIFVLMTPVETDEAGCHYYVEGSHDLKIFKEMVAKKKSNIELFYDNRPELAQATEQLFLKDSLILKGPAGTCFLSDGFGLHRGRPPEDKPRLLLWMRFGLFNNLPKYPSFTDMDPAAARAIAERLPNTQRHDVTFRLIKRAAVAA